MYIYYAPSLQEPHYEFHPSVSLSVCLTQSVRRVAELDRRRLRSSSSDDVIIPTTRLVTVGDRAFAAAGSRLWNSLPPDIRSAQTLPVFCNRLKTYLFSKCFST